jgi:hypothetical protein
VWTFIKIHGQYFNDCFCLLQTNLLLIKGVREWVILELSLSDA